MRPIVMPVTRHVPSGDQATTPPPSIVRERAALACLLLLTVLFAAGFSWLSVLRHLAFQSHAFDLGNMDQAVWNTLHGQVLRFTDMEVGDHVLTTRLAIHVEPILIPISLLYLLHSGPASLLVLQACVTATGAVPAYLLARRLSLGPIVALAFPVAYLAHPSLQNALLDDFHAVTMSAALLLWALYFAWTDRMGWFLVFGVLASACKEEVSLLVGGLGLMLLVRGRRAGLAVAVGGLIWFLLCVAVIIPHFNPGGHSPYLARYAYLGHGLTGVMKGVIRHPGTVISVLTSATRRDYVDVLLDPPAFVSLLGLPVLLPALPGALIDMLSADPTMYSGYYQYAAEIVPFVVAAAVVGVAACARAGRRAVAAESLAPVLALLVVAASLVSTRLYGFTPLAAGYTIPGVGRHQSVETSLLRTIPPAAVVSAADEIEPHLADRRTIYLLPALHPTNGPVAEYVVLDASVPSLPVTPRILHDTILRAEASGDGIEAARDGILILRRGVPSRRLPASFYSFIFTGTPRHALSARWGSLHLVGVTVHPANGDVDRSRPAIEVESYWRLSGPAHGSIRFLLSPVFTGFPPPVSRWTVSTDSPTLDWLPMGRWPSGRRILVASLPLLPDTYQAGNVEVAIQVRGTHSLSGAPRRLDSRTVLIGTVTVRASY